MKRYLIALLLISFGISLTAERVSQSQAVSIARGFMASKYNYVLGQCSPQKLSVASGNEADFYVVRFEPQGFVLIAGDTRSVPILGYSYDSEFPTGEIPAHIKWYFFQYSLAMEEIRMRPDLQEDPDWIAYGLNDYSSMNYTRDISPLIATSWDQNWPYNSMCPADNNGPGSHVYAGCVATTMAQIMKRWGLPTTGSGSHSYNAAGYGVQTANFGETTYNWAAMPNRVYSVNTHVSTIIYHCGVAVNMNYSANGSGATSTNARNAFINYFRFQNTAQLKQAFSYTAENWASMIRAELDLGRPMYYAGTGNQGGHAFNLDGYQGTNYFHFNWGWSGTYNGWFYLNNLNPGTNNFTQSQEAIFGLAPIEGVADDLEAESLNGPTTVHVNQNTTFTATIANNGHAGQNQFSIKLMRSPNIQLASVAGTFIAAGETASFDINWIPSSAGNYSLYTKVVLSGDQAPTNNQSSPINVVVTPIPAPPYNLVAQEANDLVNLSWGTPIADNGAWLHYDVSDSFSSYGTGDAVSFDAAIRFPVSALSSYSGMSLRSVKVWPAQQGSFKIRVWTGGNASAAGTLVADQAFTPVLGTYNTVILNNPVPITANQELWVGYNCEVTGGYPAGYDEGPASNGLSNMIRLQGNWTTLTQISAAMNFNWNIRAYVGNSTPEPAPLPSSLSSLNAGHDQHRMSNSLSGYKLWRLREGQETNQDTWASLTPALITNQSYQDTGWNDLLIGTYRWAARAYYANGAYSAATLSNPVFKAGDSGILTGMIKTMHGSPIPDALISCDLYSASSNVSGIYTMHVPAGIHVVTASHPAYETGTVMDVVISTGQTTNLDIQLPYAFSHFTESFESYDNFAIRFAPWIVNDVDQGATYGIAGASWENQYEPQAFIIFNPSATTPPLNNIIPHSGSKLAACFGSTTPPNNDWLISPEIYGATELNFWARSFSTSPGLERFKVGVSTSGTHPDNFFIISGSDYLTAPIAWTQFTFPLTPFMLTPIRIGIQCVSQGSRMFMIDDFTIEGESAADDPLSPAIQSNLGTNYPNPFKQNTVIPFRLEKDMPISIGIYNLKGQLVRKLADEQKRAGDHSMLWDGSDDNGTKVSAGIYFAVLKTEQTQQRIKMLYLK